MELRRVGGGLLVHDHQVHRQPAQVPVPVCAEDLAHDRGVRRIVDVEHTYLYSPATMARIFSMHGFAVRRVGAVRNRYSVRYLTRLLPLPEPVKRPLLGWLQRHPLGRLRLSVPLGGGPLFRPN